MRKGMSSLRGGVGVALTLFFLVVGEISGGGIGASGEPSFTSTSSDTSSDPSFSSHSPLCHPSCDCLDTYFDCRRRGLFTLPHNLPTWIQKLNVSNNEIRTIQPKSIARLKQLAVLSLDGNNLTEIPSCPIQLKSLTYLSLSRNGLSSIDGIALGSYVGLRELDLSRNRIQTISNDSFPLNSSIRVLNLGGNGLEVLDSGAFHSLIHLEELILTRNKISSVSKTLFLKTLNLHKLDLSRNKLDQLDSLRFQELKKLHSLNLRRNGMRNLSDAAFYGLDKLETLYLDGNGISFVERRWLYGLCSLKTLNLSHNALEDIEDNCWEYMVQLQSLDLSWNGLKRVGVGTLKSLSHLTHFLLSHNHITSLEAQAFLPLDKLKLLDLSFNEISWALEDMEAPFQGLSSCEILNVGWNKLETLHPSALKGLESLRSLTLSSNPIRSLSPSTFQYFPHLNLIMDNVTTLICDCHVQWLHSKLSSSPHVVGGGAKGRGRHRETQAMTTPTATHHLSPKCQYPPDVYGSSFTQVSINELTCQGEMGGKFVVEPKTETLLMDGTGLVSCAAQSHAQFNISWTKDRGPLPSHQMSEVETLERMLENGWTQVTSRLKLGNVSWADAGTYQCVAHTATGRIYSPQANLTVHIFPSFVKKPSNVTVRLGSNAKLECGAKGHPSPEIAFQKEGGENFPAALERRFHVMPNDDSFIIMQVKLVDMGVYCCSATNAAGEIRTCASVTVFQTPSLVSKMGDSRVVEGSNTILECLATGSPLPQVSWSKDALFIRGDSKRFKFKENGTLLIIKDVQVTDAGRYECLLSNAVGTARHSLTLTVIPSGSSGMVHWSSPLMIIALVVVAALCVVATILAWFVVICRDRGKRSTFVRSGEGSGVGGGAGGCGPTSQSILGSRVDHIDGGGVVVPSALFTYQGEGVGGDGGSQSSSGKDSGTGDDLPSELESIPILQSEHYDSLMLGSWRNKPELETFSTFGGGRTVGRVAAVGGRKHSDVISVSTHPPGREFLTLPRKVGVPLPPPSFQTKSTSPLGETLQLNTPPPPNNNSSNSGCGGSTSSSSGYSTLGIRNKHGRKGDGVWTESSGSGTDYMSSTDALSHPPQSSVGISSDAESLNGGCGPLISNQPPSINITAPSSEEPRKTSPPPPTTTTISTEV